MIKIQVLKRYKRRNCNLKQIHRIYLEHDIVKHVTVDSSWTVEKAIEAVKKKIKAHKVDDSDYVLYETQNDKRTFSYFFLILLARRELNDPDQLLSDAMDDWIVSDVYTFVYKFVYKKKFTVLIYVILK